MFALFAAMAFGQAPAPQGADRVFHLTQKQTPQELQEIATLIRARADLKQVCTEDAQKIAGGECNCRPVDAGCVPDS